MSTTEINNIDEYERRRTSSEPNTTDEHTSPVHLEDEFEEPAPAPSVIKTNKTTRQSQIPKWKPKKELSKSVVVQSPKPITTLKWNRTNQSRL